MTLLQTLAGRSLVLKAQTDSNLRGPGLRIPGLADIRQTSSARLQSKARMRSKAFLAIRATIALSRRLPDPTRYIAHGDIWPPNVMMNDDLQVTGLIDFSFTTRVGDHVVDLSGACHFLLATKSSSQSDHDYLKRLILSKHGAEAVDWIGLYAVWFPFDFAFNHDDAAVFAGCVNPIRGFAAD